MGERSKVIKLSLTPLELKEIRDSANEVGLQPAVFCRRASLAQPLPQPIFTRQGLAHLSRLGGNLNQIALKLNTGGALTPGDAKAIADAVSYTRDLREAILNGFSSDR